MDHGKGEEQRPHLPSLGSLLWAPAPCVAWGGVGYRLFFFKYQGKTHRRAEGRLCSTLGRSGRRLLLSVTVSETQVGNSKYKTDEQRKQQSGTSNSRRENQSRQGRVLQSAHQIYMQIVMLTLYMINQNTLQSQTRMNKTKTLCSSEGFGCYYYMKLLAICFVSRVHGICVYMLHIEFGRK